MKKLFIIIAFTLAMQANAQVEQVMLQASGLTCSMCSKAIYKALKKLSFADNITSNIEQSTYTLSFNNNKPVDFDAIRKAVEDAGFSVVNMAVKARFDNVEVKNDAHIMLNGEVFHFLDVKNQTLQGEQTIQIVDRNFVADKVYKKYAATTSMKCVKTGLMQPCCHKVDSKEKRIYHVTV